MDDQLTPEELLKYNEALNNSLKEENYMKSFRKEEDMMGDYEYYKDQYDYSTKTQPGLASITKVPDNLSEYDRLGATWRANSQFNQDNLANKQGSGEQIGNALNKAFWNTLYDTAGGIGAMFDIEDYYNQDNEVGNWLSNWANEQKKEVAKENPIYLRKDAGALNSTAWWLENGSSLVSSAGSFMLQGAGLSKGLQAVKWLGKMGWNKGKNLLTSPGVAAKRGTDMATGAKYVDDVGLGSKLSSGKNILRGRKAEDLATTLLTSTMLNQSEAIMSATEVYDKIYKDAINRGYSEEYAKSLAASSASNTININRANIAFNLTSADMFLKGTKNIQNLNKSNLFKKSLVEGVQEGIEENINLIAQKQGERYGQERLDASDRGLIDLGKAPVYNAGLDIQGNPYYDASSKEMFETTLLGSLGGIAQTTATQPIMDNIGSSDSKGLLGRIPGGVGDKWVDFRSALFGQKQADRYTDTETYPDGSIKHRKGDIKYEMEERTYDENENYNQGTVLTDENISEDAKAKGYKVGDVIKEDDVIENKKGDVMTITGEDGKKESLLDYKRDDKGRRIVKYKQDSRGKDKRFSIKELRDQRTKDQKAILEAHKDNLDKNAKIISTAKYQRRLENGIKDLEDLVNQGNTMSKDKKKETFDNLAYLELANSGELDITRGKVAKKSNELQEEYNKGNISERDLRNKQNDLLDFSLARTSLQAFDNGTQDYLKGIYKDIQKLSEEDALEKGYDLDYKETAQKAIDKIDEYYYKWIEYNAKHSPDVAKALYMNRVNYDQLNDKMIEINNASKKTEDDIIKAYSNKSDDDVNELDKDGLSKLDKFKDAIKINREKNKKVKSDKEYNKLLKNRRALLKERDDLIKGNIEGELTPTQQKTNLDKLIKKIEDNDKAISDRLETISKPFNDKLDKLGLKDSSPMFSPLMDVYNSKLDLINQANDLDAKFDNLRSNIGSIELENIRNKQAIDRYTKKVFNNYMREIMELQDNGGGVSWGNNIGKIIRQNNEFYFEVNREAPFNVDEDFRNELIKLIKPGKEQDFEKWLNKKTNETQNKIKDVEKQIKENNETDSDQLSDLDKEKLNTKLNDELNQLKTDLENYKSKNVPVPSSMRLYRDVKGQDGTENEGLYIMVQNGTSDGQNKLWYRPKGKTGYKAVKPDSVIKAGDEIFQGESTNNLITLGELKTDKIKEDFNLDLDQPIDLLDRNTISIPLDIESSKNLSLYEKDNFDKLKARDLFVKSFKSRAARYNRAYNNEVSLLREKIKQKDEIEQKLSDFINKYDSLEKAYQDLSNGNLLDLLKANPDPDFLKLTALLSKLEGYKQDFLNDTTQQLKDEIQAYDEQIKEDLKLINDLDKTIDEVNRKLGNKLKISDSERNNLNNKLTEARNKKSEIYSKRIPELQAKINNNKRAIDDIAEIVSQDPTLVSKAYRNAINVSELSTIIDKLEDQIRKSEVSAELLQGRIDNIINVIKFLKKAKNEEKDAVRLDMINNHNKLKDDIIKEIVEYYFVDDTEGITLQTVLDDETNNYNSIDDIINDIYDGGLNLINNISVSNVTKELVREYKEAEADVLLIDEQVIMNDAIKEYNQLIRENKEELVSLQEELQKLQGSIDQQNQVNDELYQELQKLLNESNDLPYISDAVLAFMAKFDEQINSQYVAERAGISPTTVEGEASLLQQIEEAKQELKDEFDRLNKVEDGITVYDRLYNNVEKLIDKIVDEADVISKRLYEIGRFKSEFDNMTKKDINSLTTNQLDEFNQHLDYIKTGQLTTDLQTEVDFLNNEKEDLQLELDALKELYDSLREVYENTPTAEVLSKNIETVKQFADKASSDQQEGDDVDQVEEGLKFLNDELNKVNKKIEDLEKLEAENSKVGVRSTTEDGVETESMDLNIQNQLDLERRDLEDEKDKIIESIQTLSLNEDVKDIDQLRDLEKEIDQKESELDGKLSELEEKKKTLERKLNASRAIFSEMENTGFKELLFEEKLKDIKEKEIEREFNNNNQANNEQRIYEQEPAKLKEKEENNWNKGKFTIFSTMNANIQWDGSKAILNEDGIPMPTNNEHNLRMIKFLNSISTEFGKFKGEHKLQFIKISNNGKPLVQNSVINDLPAYDKNKKDGTLLSKDLEYGSTGVLAVITNKKGQWLHVNEEGERKYLDPHAFEDGFKPLFSNIPSANRPDLIKENMILQNLKDNGKIKNTDGWKQLLAKKTINLGGKNYKVSKDPKSPFYQLVSQRIRNNMENFRNSIALKSSIGENVYGNISMLSDGHLIRYPDKTITASSYLTSDNFDKFVWTSAQKGQIGKLDFTNNVITSGIPYIKMKDNTLIDVHTEKLDDDDIEVILKLIDNALPNKQTYNKEKKYKTDENEEKKLSITSVYKNGKISEENIGLLNKVLHWAGNKGNKNIPFSIWLEKGRINWIDKNRQQKSIPVEFINTITNEESYGRFTMTALENKRDTKLNRGLSDFIKFLRTKNKHVEFKLLNSDKTYYHPELNREGQVVVKKYNNYKDYLVKTNKLKTSAVPLSELSKVGLDNPNVGRYLEFNIKQKLFDDPVKTEKEETPPPVDNEIETEEVPDNESDELVKVSAKSLMDLSELDNGESVKIGRIHFSTKVLLDEGKKKYNFPQMEIKNVNGENYVRFTVFDYRLQKDNTFKITRLTSFYKVEDDNLVFNDEYSKYFEDFINDENFNFNEDMGATANGLIAAIKSGEEKNANKYAFKMINSNNIINPDGSSKTFDLISSYYKAVLGNMYTDNGQQIDTLSETDKNKIRDYEIFRQVANVLSNPNMTITNNTSWNIKDMKIGNDKPRESFVTSESNEDHDRETIQILTVDYNFNKQLTPIERIKNAKTVQDVLDIPVIKKGKYRKLLDQFQGAGEIKAKFNSNGKDLAYYSIPNKTLIFTPESIKKLSKSSDIFNAVMTHEIIHHYTVEYLKDDKNKNDKNVKRLEKLRNGVIQYLINNPDHPLVKAKSGKRSIMFYVLAGSEKMLPQDFDKLIRTSKDYKDFLNNAKKKTNEEDLSEFIANIFNSKNFTKFLNELDVKEVNKLLDKEDQIELTKKSLFKEFVNIIRDILSNMNIILDGKLKNQSILEEALLTATDILGDRGALKESGELVINEDIDTNKESEINTNETTTDNTESENTGNKILDKKNKIYNKVKEIDVDNELAVEDYDKIVDFLAGLDEDDKNDILDSDNIEDLEDGLGREGLKLAIDIDEDFDNQKIKSEITSRNTKYTNLIDLIYTENDKNNFLNNLKNDEDFNNIKEYYNYENDVDPLKHINNFIDLMYEDYLTNSLEKPYLKDFFDKITKEAKDLNLDLKMNNPNNVFNGVTFSQQNISDLYEGMTHYLFEEFRKGDIDSFFDGELDATEIYYKIRKKLKKDMSKYAKKISNKNLDISKLNLTGATNNKVESFLRKYNALANKENLTDVEKNQLNSLNKQEEDLNKVLTHIIDNDKSFKKLIKQHSEFIRSFGLTFSEDVLDNIEVESEAVKDKAYNKDATQFNQKDSLPPAVKLLVASLRNLRENKLSESEVTSYLTQTNDLNLPSPNDFDLTYNLISKNVANLPADSSILEQAIRDLHDREVNYNKAIGSVLTELFEGKKSLYNLKNTKGDDLTLNEIKLLQQFAQAFSKFSPRFYTSRIDNEGVMHFIDSNRNKTSNKIIRNWTENFKDTMDELTDGTRMLKKSKATELVNNLSGLASVRNRDRKYYKELRKLLQELGLQFNNLQQIEKELAKSNKSILSVINAKNSIKDQLNDAIANSVEGSTHIDYNPIQNRDTLGTIKLLADIEAKFSNQVVDNQFISADNKTVYGITLNHFLSTAVSNINYYAQLTDDNDLNMLRTEMPHLFNAFSNNSVLINDIEKNGLQVNVGMLNGMTAQNNQGKVIKDLNAPDRWAMMIGSTMLKGMYSFYRAADRGTENYFSFTNEDGSPHKLYGHNTQTAKDAHFGYLLDDINAMVQFRDGLGQDIEFYRKKGGEFRFFGEGDNKDPKLQKDGQLTTETRNLIKTYINEGLSSEAIQEKLKEPAMYNSIMNQFEVYFKNRANETKAKIKELGLLDKVPDSARKKIVWSNESKSYVETDKPNARGIYYAGISADLMKDYLNIVGNNDYEAALDRLLYDFELIQTGAYIEQNKLFVGDPAMFKNSDDFFKRMSMMNSTKKNSVYDKEIDQVLDNNNVLNLVEDGQTIMLTKEEMVKIINNNYQVKPILLNEDTINKINDFNNVEVKVGIGFNPSLLLTDGKRGSHFNSIIINDVKSISSLADDNVDSITIENGVIKYFDKNKGETKPSDLRKLFTEEFYQDGITNVSNLQAKVESYLDPYLGMDEADAQAYVTLPAYKEILLKAGDWSNKHEKAYTKLVQGKPLSTDEQFLFRVLKTQYTGVLGLDESSNGNYKNGDPVTDSNKNLFVPTGYKHSIFPLVPEFIKGTNLEKLNNVMLKNNISVAHMASANKFGRKLKDGNINSMYNENGDFAITDSNLISQSSPWRYFGVQLDQAAKLKKNITASTQFRKLVLSNLIDRGVPVDYTQKRRAEDPTISDKRIQRDWNEIKKVPSMAKSESKMYSLVSEYNEIQKVLFKKPFDQLVRELDLRAVVDKDDNITGYEINNRSSLISIVEEMAKDRNMSENIKESIQDLYDTTSYLEQVLNKEKVENVLYAVVNSRIIREKRKGEGAPQVAVSGFESTDQIRDYENKKIKSSPVLRTYIQSSNGNTIPTQMMIALPKDWIEWVDAKYGSLDKFNERLEQLHNKLDDIEIKGSIIKLNEEEKNLLNLITIIGFRIPNQGLNSSDVARIKKFLPYSAGDSVVVPTEMVAKAGSDFDIDKLNLYYPHYRKPSIIERNGKTIIKDPQYIKINDGRTAEDIQRRYIDYVYSNVTKKDKEGLDFTKEDLMEDSNELKEIAESKSDTVARLKQSLEQSQETKDNFDKFYSELGRAIFKAVPSRYIKQELYDLDHTIRTVYNKEGIEKQELFLSYVEKVLEDLDPTDSYTWDYQKYNKDTKEYTNDKETFYGDKLKGLIDSIELLRDYYVDQIAFLQGREPNNEFTKEMKELVDERNSQIETIRNAKPGEAWKKYFEQRKEDLNNFYYASANKLADNKKLLSYKQFSELSLNEQNSKEQLQNRMIELHKDIITLPYNYRQLLAPVSDAVLADTSIGKVWDVRMYSSLIDPSGQLFKIIDAKAKILKNYMSEGNVVGALIGKNVIPTSKLTFKDGKILSNNKEVQPTQVIFNDNIRNQISEDLVESYNEFKSDWSSKDKKKRKESSLSDIASTLVNMDKFVNFLSGKAGVGQTAVHITHHQLGMAVDLYDKRGNNYWVFDHNKNADGFSSFAGKKDVQGEWLSETLSAFLNAYVDIAKDPYVFDLNAGNSTANAILMLLRSGASVGWVSRFMSQPIIKDYVKLQQSNESFFKKSLGMEKSKSALVNEILEKYIPNELKNLSLESGETGKSIRYIDTMIFKINEGIDQDANKLFSKYYLTNDSEKKEAYKNQYDSLKEEYTSSNTKKWKEYSKLQEAGLFSEDRLAEYMTFNADNLNQYSDTNETFAGNDYFATPEGKKAYNNIQVALLDLFLEYQRQSKDFQMMIRASSPDTKGLDKNLQGNEIMLEEFEKVKFFDNYGNFDNLFEETIISQPHVVAKESVKMYNSMYYTKENKDVDTTIKVLFNNLASANSYNKDKKTKLVDDIQNDFFNALITSGMIGEQYKPKAVFEQLFINNPNSKYIDKNGNPASLPTIMRELSDRSINVRKLKRQYKDSDVKPSVIALQSLSDNMFINELVAINPTESYKDYSEFYNDVRVYNNPKFGTLRLTNRKMTPEKANRLTSSLAIIKESNPDLYSDLIRFSLLQSGFNTTPISFTSYLPQGDINNLKKEAIKAFEDLDVDTQNRLLANFHDQFLRHSVNHNPTVNKISRYQEKKRKDRDGQYTIKTGKFNKTYSVPGDSVIADMPFLFKFGIDEKGNKFREAIQGKMKKDYKVFHGKGGFKNFISTIPVVGNGIYFKGYSISDGETLNYRRDEDDFTSGKTDTVDNMIKSILNRSDIDKSSSNPNDNLNLLLNLYNKDSKEFNNKFDELVYSPASFTDSNITEEMAQKSYIEAIDWGIDQIMNTNGEDYASDSKINNIDTREKANRVITYDLGLDEGSMLFTFDNDYFKSILGYLTDVNKQTGLDNLNTRKGLNLSDKITLRMLNSLKSNIPTSNISIKSNNIQQGNVTINKQKWNENSPKQNPNTAYVFTENINSIGSSRKGGGSAIIRNNPNAVGIVTKKYYTYKEDRNNNNKDQWNENFKDTDSDFELFKKVNLEQFNKIDKFKDKIFPDSFASSLAAIPTRFAEWLQNELDTRYGLVTELNNKGTGLISKSVKSNQPDLFTDNVQGENISSKGSEFAKKLTNPGNNLKVNYKGNEFRNAEHAYQTWKSGTFDSVAYSKGLEGNIPSSWLKKPIIEGFHDLLIKYDSQILDKSKSTRNEEVRSKVKNYMDKYNIIDGRFKTKSISIYDQINNFATFNYAGVSPGGLFDIKMSDEYPFIKSSNNIEKINKMGEKLTREKFTSIKFDISNARSRTPELVKKYVNLQNEYYKLAQEILKDELDIDIPLIKNPLYADSKAEKVTYNYQKGDFKPVGSKRANKNTNFNTMIEILTAKLEQHPELIKGITSRGGDSYLKNSTHNVTGDNFWESKGQNKFIEALRQAYSNTNQTKSAIIEDTRNPFIKVKSEGILVSELKDGNKQITFKSPKGYPIVVDFEKGMKYDTANSEDYRPLFSYVADDVSIMQVPSREVPKVKEYLTQLLGKNIFGKRDIVSKEFVNNLKADLNTFNRTDLIISDYENALKTVNNSKTLSDNNFLEAELNNYGTHPHTDWTLLTGVNPKKSMFEMNNSEKEEYYKEFAEKAKKVYENALKNPSTFKSISKLVDMNREQLKEIYTKALEDFSESVDDMNPNEVNPDQTYHVNNGFAQFDNLRSYKRSMNRSEPTVGVNQLLTNMGIELDTVFKGEDSPIKNLENLVKSFPKDNPRISKKVTEDFLKPLLKRFKDANLGNIDLVDRSEITPLFFDSKKQFYNRMGIDDQTMSAIDTDIDEQQLLRDAVKDTNSQIKKEKDNRCNS